MSEAAQASSARRWTFALRWLIVIGFGLAQAIAFRHEMNPDGVSYLDFGDAMFRLDRHMMSNTYWSPLYPLLLTALTRLTRLASRSEFTGVHAMNFFIYLGTYAAFQFFWKSLVTNDPERDRSTIARTAPIAWECVGCLLFTYAALAPGQVAQVTPDLLMDACLFVACGAMMRLGRGSGRVGTAVLLGGALGVGYLAKAPMFPIAGACFAACLCSPHVRRSWGRLAIAIGVWAVLVSPWVAFLSAAKGRLTFGDSGRVNYLDFVDHVIPHSVGPYGPMPGTTLTPPVRQLLSDPDVYAFTGAVGGTYPVWYDPSYWADGAVVQLRLDRQVTALAHAARQYASIHARLLVYVLAIVVTVCLVSRQTAAGLVRGLADDRYLWLPAAVVVVALIMFAAVHVAPRYVVMPFVMFWCCLLASIRLPERVASSPVVSTLVLAFTAVMVLSLARLALKGPGVAVREGDALSFQVADGLQNLGMAPGDRIALVGNGYHAYWARLNRVGIVAQIAPRDPRALWALAPDRRTAAVRAVAIAGASWVVTDWAPPSAPLEGWQPIGQTGYYALPRARALP